MSQPEKVTPSYLGPAGQQELPSLYAALKEQVLAPQYRDDNLRYVPFQWICKCGSRRRERRRKRGEIVGDRE